jgi:hypothetical protein
MATKVYSVEELIETESNSRAKFQKLDSSRSSVLDRARECSKLTIPSVVTDDGHTESDDLTTPYQAVGSRLVHNLANKLLLALLPPNTSFFRLLPNPEVVDVLKQQEGNTDELEKNLVTIENEMMKQIEREALRVPIFEAIKSLIIGGNALLFKTEGGVKSYRMANYVVQRDFSGNPIEIIAKESLSKHSLPEDILQQILSDPDLQEAEKVTIFTRCIKKEGTWYMFQEVEGFVVEGSEQTFKADDEIPFIPLRWTSINGENYGRGLVEQYLGDFRSLEALYQLLLEASSVMSRVIFGKRAGSVLDVDDINEAENGVCILGDLENDITVLRVDKGADLNVPMNMVQDLTRRLEQAFLVASSAARDSERTTATEVRMMAADLENSLGGVYSLLSLELQLPLASLLLKQSKINVQSLGIDLVIVTGVEALGRTAELDRIRQFNALIQEIGAPEMVLSRMNVGVYIDKIANALSMDASGLIKSDEQLAQEQQAQQQQQMMQQGQQGLMNAAEAQLSK